MIFISKLAQDLIPTLEKAIEIGMSIDDAKVRYKQFYHCLQNSAVTGDLSCIDSAVRNVGFSKPQDAIALANLYIKMYRASRLALVG